MRADQEQYMASHPSVSSVLADDALYRALNEAATALSGGRASTVMVQLNDGQMITGPPQVIYLGTVPILIIVHVGRRTFFP